MDEPILAVLLVFAGTACADMLRIDRSALGSGGTCGNGMLDEGEACDDGNTVDTDNCTKSCEQNRYQPIFEQVPRLQYISKTQEHLTPTQ